MIETSSFFSSASALPSPGRRRRKQRFRGRGRVGDGSGDRRRCPPSSSSSSSPSGGAPFVLPSLKSSLLPMTTTTMTMMISLLLLILPGIHAQTFSCTDFLSGSSWNSASRSGTSSSALSITNPGESSTITLTNTLAEGQLCTLFSVFVSELDENKRYYIPMGRSYDGNPWERVAGRNSELVYTCSGSSCTVDLPDTDITPYYMAAYSYSLDSGQKFVRFMERASFGAKYSDMTGSFADGTVSKMAQWIDAQHSLPPTSHREYFRKRLNPRSLEMYKYGRAGPHPCDRYSRWRNFAFTRKDKVMSIGYIKSDWPMVMHNVTLETRDATVDGTDQTRYAWTYAGHLRTMMETSPQWSDGTSNPGDDVPLGTYDVCAVDEAPGRGTYPSDDDEILRTMYARFKIVDAGGNCGSGGRHVFGGNPPVEIHPEFLTEEETDPHVLDFSSLDAGEFEDNLAGYDPSGSGGIGHADAKTYGDSVVYLDMTTYRDANADACAAVPDPNEADFRSKGWIYSPYYAGRRHPDWDPSTRSILDPPVFALVSGSTYRLHDRRYTPFENSIDNPKDDGGGKQTIESVFIEVNSYDEDDEELTVVDEDENPRTFSSVSGEEQAIYCSNGEPNVFNEAGCKLSTEADTCVREEFSDEDTVVVMKLTEASLAAINDRIVDSEEGLLAVGRPLAITGLPLGDITDKPCDLEAVSRWKVVQDNTVTDEAGCETESGVTDLGSDTKAAFQHLFGYSVSNNEFVKDVRMHAAFPDMACDAGDAAKSGFSIWHADANACYLHVHPDEMEVYLVKDAGVLANILPSFGTRSYADLTTTDGVTDWNTFKNAQVYLGMIGELVKLNGVMDKLEIYEQLGGKDVTAAPTSSPSEPPTTMPSKSSGPSASISPSILPSEEPSFSGAPSDVPSTSYVPTITTFPSDVPSTTTEPSSVPSSRPSFSSWPSEVPSTSWLPSDVPSTTVEPSSVPSSRPSFSSWPSEVPSTSVDPSSAPSSMPSSLPSSVPSNVPSSGVLAPSSQPSMEPSQLSQIARTRTDNVYASILNDEAIAEIVLKTHMKQKTGGVLICGSSGEIAPDVTEDDYFDYWNWRLDSSGPEGEQKKTVWTNIALTSDDQLCQRTAWALSQIFQISPAFLGYSTLSEAHMNYYDGFVRNCHNQYKQVMKTVAFSVKMGQQLSHVGSTSLRYAMDRSGNALHPDENYAREAMQLETVGLDLLNMDGTVKRDNLGVPIPTYDTNDILTFARAWTGLEYAIRRGNYEENDPITNNWNDPMLLKDGDRHDWFPKKDLEDNWIGDRYPLCSDLPQTAFLKRGATYKLLGRSSSPRYQYDPAWWDGNEKIKRMTLRTSSNLYDLLKCVLSAEGCVYPTVVKLTDDLVCDGLECDVDTLRVVQVARDVFYEYVRRPCVHLAFNPDAVTVFAGSVGASMCADPTQPVATTTCCPSGGASEISCIYHGEKVTYVTNEARCGNSGDVCPAGTENVNNGDNCEGQVAYSTREARSNHFQWTSGSCSTKIKVRIDAMVALVHVPDSVSNVVRYVQNSVRNMNFFHVPWPIDSFQGDELFPNVDNECGEGACIVQNDDTCLCDVTITNIAVFDSNPADADAIRSALKIGAFPPEHLEGYDSGVTLPGDSSVTVYHKDGSYSVDTIFKLTDETDEFIELGDEYKTGSSEPVVGVMYLKNFASTINIGATGEAASDYFTEPERKPLEMRNPVLFHDLVDPEVRDAHYEIDAVINHLTSHPNAAPFVSLQLIQHLAYVASPSPNYIERVAEVYRAGTYTTNSVTFGDGRFGNLDAVVAAILLDQEATAGTLDADPASGGLKEPINKVLQFMRAMDYVQNPFDRNIYPKLSGMVGKVGQMAYESRDQFSFFLSDYSPPGQFAQAGVYAPPAQVLTLYTTVATIEGFFSLARHGLSSSSGGFGSGTFGHGVVQAGDTSKSVGYLSYGPNGSSDTENVQLIADLLTAGRLSPDAVNEIADAVSETHSGEPDKKVQLAQQLIATSPEFHSTNLAQRTENERDPTPLQERAPDSYKAIVVLFLSGGLDSFNVLTPHTTCSLYNSYRKNREGLALSDREMLRIASDDEDQPCTSFGINNQIPILKDIYDNGHGQWHANVGHLHKPVTKGNWYTETRTHLFSHTSMEREAHLVDAFQEDGWSTGVAGRMLDVLQRRGLSVSAIGIDSKGFILEGNPSLGRTVEVIPSGGVNVLDRRSLTDTSNNVEDIEPLLKYLNKETELETSGIYANYWAQNLVDVLNKTDTLSELISDFQLDYESQFQGSVGRQLRMVAKLMLKNAERQSNRDVFLVSQGGHDGHALSKENLGGRLPTINTGISAFYNQMRHSNMLDSLTFVMISEFGRTITPNTGKGCDHAWGGNAFVFGGQIRGSTILGQYPTSFDNTDLNNIGRGRLVPFRSWESIWYGVANWFNITDGTDMEYVLPNNGNMGCQLYTDRDMYTVGNTTIGGCNDRTVEMKLSMLLHEPRYLTGLEQKRICKAAISLTASNADVTSRCVVTDQKVIVYFDTERRVLSAGDLDGRSLQELANYTLEATIGYAYDNPNGTLDGTSYVENSEQFTEHLNEQISSGGNCPSASSTGRRRLNEDRQFCIDICDEVTSFEAILTSAPSLVPSTSTQPSSQPSSFPSSQPSEIPSISVFPTEKEPSLAPSISISPTPPAPSSKPSVPPSSMPTMDCPNVIEFCSNGGMWSPYTCECLCVSKYCPNADSGLCTETSCPANYQDTLFDDQPPPWFNFGSSCTSTKDLPSSVKAIYGSKEKCCQSEYSNDSAGCVQRPAAVNELRYNGKLQLVGLNCPTSGSERVSAAGTMARAVLSSICSNTPGLTCGDGAKVVVQRFCSSDYSVEATYSSGSRRLTTDTDADIVEFVFYQQSLDPNTLETLESLLSSHLQGTSLTTFLSNVLSAVLADDPPPSLQALSAIYYTAVNAFIVGLGLYYPAWGYRETCLSDGGQENYMNRNPSSWMYETLNSCCQRYYGWDVIGCELLNAEETMVSGAISALDPTDGLYFPDWGRTDTCINDGTAPPYMKKQSSTWMYESLTACCEAYFGWEKGFAECMSLQGEPPTRAPIGESWYVDWEKFVCVESCNGPSPCGGDHEPWDVLHSSKSECCKAHLWWQEDCLRG